MTVNLGNFHKQKHTQTSLLNNADFQIKNRITINNPTPAHFSVQGVQSYTTQEIKAMKQRQQRKKDNKQGQYIPLKTVLLSDEIIDWPQDGKKLEKTTDGKSRAKKQGVKQAKFCKMKQPSDEPLKQYLKKRREQRINKKNAVSTNNQTIVKMEKNIAKKQALTYKLQKMQKMYKQHFKDIQLGEKPNTGNCQSEESQKQQQRVSDNAQQIQITPQKQQDRISIQQKMVQNNQNKDTSQKNNKNAATTNMPQTTNKQFDDQFSEQQSQNLSSKTSLSDISQKSETVYGKMLGNKNKGKNGQQKNKGLKIGLNLMNNCTSYSQKLGTAIYQMFG